jgi:hypothetical protein
MRVNLSHAWSAHDWFEQPRAAAVITAHAAAAPAAASPPRSPRSSEWTLVQYADDLQAPWVTLVRWAGPPAPA